MIKIGITGSISSGKTTATKIISLKRGPIFSADRVVQKLLEKNSIKKLVANKLRFSVNLKFKNSLRNLIIEKKKNLNKLEKILHPRVRKEMNSFLHKNRRKKFLFFEIPLLIENNLKHSFDKIIFIKSKKALRLKRYKLTGGNEALFDLLDSRQIKDTEKSKFCDHIVINNNTLNVLKQKLSNIIKLYE